MALTETSTTTDLDDLHRQQEHVWRELQAIAGEPSPWYAGGRYYARTTDASVARARLIDARLAHLDRIETAIARVHLMRGAA